MAIENEQYEGKMLHIAPPRLVVLGLFILTISGSLLLCALFFKNLKEYSLIGSDLTAQSTITVTGTGETFAAPDIATISFSILGEAKTPAEARVIVDDRMKKIHDFLSSSGIAEKDIKTTGYNLNPRYEWEQKQIVCIAYPCIQPQGKQVLIGYEVTQSVEVKVRNLDDAGKVLGGLTDNGATNVGGLNFMVENEDAVKAKAREDAITKAKAKAEKLASQLGVTLVRIVSFDEGGNSPIYYARGGAEMKTMSADAASLVPNVPAGENKYMSNVTIVYEIH